MRIVMMFAFMFAACALPADDAPPTGESEQPLSEGTDNLPGFNSCASLGCPLKPSGSSSIWVPCTVTFPCFCGNPAVRCVQPAPQQP